MIIITHNWTALFASDCVERQQSLLKLPFLSAHGTGLVNLLRIEPFDDAVDVETV